MPNQESAKLRAASIECSYSNRRQREHILSASDYHRIVGIRKRDADYPHLLIPHLTVCLLRPTQRLNGGRPGRLPGARSWGNDGNALVSVDLAEINHAPLPARLPAGHKPVISLKAKIETLQAEPAKLPRVHSGALNRL
jgi:hypothetical protein